MNTGLGVMLHILGGNAETVEAVRHAIGRRLASATLTSDTLVLRFEDGTWVDLWDAGQSCCESRYMTCDDDLAGHAGATVVGVEEREGPTTGDESACDVHEVAFLVVTTDRGAITVATHNEHNGYYGGFALAARLSGNGSSAATTGGTR